MLQARTIRRAEVGLDGQPEAVEPFGVRGVAAEPGGQVVARPGPAVRAADPGGVLDRQRAGVDLLAVIFGQPGRQHRPQLLEGAPQPADPPVGLALVRQPREQVRPVPGHLGQEPGLAAPAQQVPHQRDGQQLGVAAGRRRARPGGRWRRPGSRSRHRPARTRRRTDPRLAAWEGASARQADSTPTCLSQRPPHVKAAPGINPHNAPKGLMTAALPPLTVRMCVLPRAPHGESAAHPKQLSVPPCHARPPTPPRSGRRRGGSRRAGCQTSGVAMPGEDADQAARLESRQPRPAERVWSGKPAVLPEQRLTGPTCGFDPPCGSQPAHPFRILHPSSSQAGRPGRSLSGR